MGEKVNWELVRAFRQKLLDIDAPKYLSRLNAVWNTLSKEYSRGWAICTHPRDEDESEYEHPVLKFVDDMDSGYVPPPEVLLALAEGFNAYLDGAGSVSLERIFFGKEVQKVGNWAAREKSNSKYREFDYLIEVNLFAEETTGVKRISLEKLAEDFCRDKHSEKYTQPIDADSFLAGYRRWKKKQQSDN